MENRHILNSILEQATKSFFASNHARAICLYEEALNLINTDLFFEYNVTEFDICVIEYSLCCCYITQEKYFQKASDELIPLVLLRGNKFPALYYGLAKICFAQQCFQQTVNVIRNGLKALGDVKEKAPFKANWPGTDVEIPESDCDVLISSLNALNKLCSAIPEMEHGDVYQSDEFENDDTEENVYSLKCPSESGNLPEGIINQNELLNKSVNTKHIQQIEDITNLNVVQKPTSRLNVEVPEFVPRNFDNNSSSMNYNPEIKYMPLLSSTPETEISSASEDKINFAPKMQSVIDNDATQSSEYHAEGYQTIAKKMIEKSVQTNRKSVDIFTQTPKSEQQQIEIKKLFKENLSAVMDENKKLHEKVKNLQEENKQKVETLEEYKQRLLQEQQKVLAAENVTQIASIKLKAREEGWQDKLAKLEREINDKKNKTDNLRKNNEIMLSVITTQTMQYFNLQQHVLTDHLNKCRRMVFDLTATVLYLSVNSIPTVADCHKHIEQWQKELKKAEHCSVLLKDCYERITKDLHLGKFTDIPNLPELFTQLTDHNDVLHDSFIPAVNILLKENTKYYQQNLQYHQQYSQWWNTSGRYNQLRPIIKALPQPYNIPKGSLDVQIGADTASSAANNSVVATSNTYFKFTTDDAKASKKPESTEAIAQSVTDNSKLSQPSNAPESSTPHLNSVMSNAEAVKQHNKTVKFANDDSNASKEDGKSFVDNGISDIKEKNGKINETANSDNSKLEQKLSDAYTNLSIDSEQNIPNETKQLEPFTIATKKIVLQRSILDETEQKSTLNNVLKSCVSSDHSSNYVPVPNMKQTKNLDNASSLATADIPVEDLAIAQPTKVDNAKQEDHNISKVFHFQGEFSDSDIPIKQHSFSFSLTKTSPSSSHELNDKTSPSSSAAPTDHLTQENLSITPTEVPKIIDYSKLPEAVRKAGRSFCDLYLYVKDRVPEKTETEILSALKKVRRKNTKLSGMTRDGIVAAVRIELKINQDNDGYTDISASASAAVNSEAAGLTKNSAQTICIVCMELLGDVPLTGLPCQHTFHRKCITQWFVYKNDCPVCRIFVV